MNKKQIAKIDEAIRSEFEVFDDDAYQNTWLAVLESSITHIDTIKKIARSERKTISSKKISDKYKHKSIYEPLRTDLSDENFTLEDILTAKPDIPDSYFIEQEENEVNKYKINGKRNMKGYISFKLSQHELVDLQNKFPGKPMNHIVRILLGLSPPQNNLAWQRWEEAIIKQRYPWGGALAVSLDINRSLDSIRERARFLGIRRRSGYNKRQRELLPDMLTVMQVSYVLGCEFSTVHKWNKLGHINIVQIYNIFDFGFITKKSLIAFIQNKPFVYDPKRITGEYSKYIPSWRQDWIYISDASERLGVSSTWINKHIHEHHIDSRWGFNHRLFVRLADIQKYMKQPKVQKRLQNANNGDDYEKFSENQGRALNKAKVVNEVQGKVLVRLVGSQGLNEIKIQGL